MIKLLTISECKEFWRFRLPSAVTLLILAVLPSRGLDVVLCPSRLLFELPCPACGLTRSISCLLHFEFGRAMQFNPIGLIALAFLIFTLVTNRTDMTAGLFRRNKSTSRQISGYLMIVGVGVAVWLTKIVFWEYHF